MVSYYFGVPVDFEEYDFDYKLDLNPTSGTRLELFSKKSIDEHKLEFLNDYYTIFFDDSTRGEGPRWKNRYILKQLSQRHPKMKNITGFVEKSIVTCLLFNDTVCRNHDCENEGGTIIHGRSGLPSELNSSTRPEFCYQCENEKRAENKQRELNIGDEDNNQYDFIDRIMKARTKFKDRSTFIPDIYISEIDHLTLVEHELYIQNFRESQIELMRIVDEMENPDIRQVFNIFINDLMQKIECHHSLLNEE